MTERRAQDPRAAARARLRMAFLAQVGEELASLASLVVQADDEAVRESVAFELEMLATRAEAVDLSWVAEEANRVAGAVRAGERDWVLRPLAERIADAGLKRAFPTLVVVASDEELLRLKQAASQHCEPMRFLSAVAPLRGPLQCEPVQGVLVPHTATGDVPELVDALGVPVFVYGPPGDRAKRLRAAHLGATAWVDEPLDLDRVFTRLRAEGLRRSARRLRALVVADADAAETIAETVERAGHDARRVSDPDADLLAQLDEVRPEIVVVADQIGDRSGTDLLAILRTDAAFGDAAVVVFGDASWVGDHPGVALAAQSPEEAAMVVVERLRMLCETVQPEDRVTGGLSRPAVLDALDRELARSRRSHEPVAVAVVDLDDLRGVNERHGRAAGDAALRLLSEVLREGVRAYDLVGRVSDDCFLVALPNCTESRAGTRVEALRRAFRERANQDPRLAGLDFSAGITDTDHGMAKLLVRADEALLRAQGRPGDERIST